MSKLLCDHILDPVEPHSADLYDDILNSGSDPLTGLASRQQFTDFLTVSVVRLESSGANIALILVDIDRFRAMSDRIGPAASEKLLRRFAQRLRMVSREASLVAHTSGGAFGLILRDTANATTFLDMLASFLTRPFAVDGQAVTLSVSMGIAKAPFHGRDAQELMHAASLAVHAARRDGGNRSRMFDPAMRQHARSLHLLETDLRAATALQRIELQCALVGQQFELYYQPQISLNDGSLTGFEALLRWRHPERGLVSPNEFIPVAEDIGLMELLGETVLRMACAETARWNSTFEGRSLRVAVNVSPFQMRNKRNLFDAIHRALADSGLPASNLELELTESALVDDITDTMIGIRDMGVTLALDDFGVGYSSIGRLSQYPFNRIKIDRSFVSKLESTTAPATWNAGESMVRAVVSLGHALGMDTICEGVETIEQLRVVKRAGCSEVQGYLLSPPVASCQVEETVRKLNDQASRDLVCLDG